MKNTIINLSDYVNNSYAALIGGREGCRLRKSLTEDGLNLREIEVDNTITIQFPENVMSVSQAFFDAFIGDRVKALGKDRFNDIYHIKCTEHVKQLISSYIAQRKLYDPLNIKEAKELIEHFRGITIEDVIFHWQVHNSNNGGWGIINVVRALCDGFDTSSCSLCRAIVKATGGSFDSSKTCRLCIFQRRLGCANNAYRKIMDSKNERELYVAIQEAANYMDGVISQWVTRKDK